MPSFIIHSAVATRLNEYLNLDEELFTIGNIMPDCWRNTPDRDTVKRTRSHFQPIGEDTKDEDYKYFCNKYKDKMNNPVYLGYLSHLLTDIYWRKYVLPEYRIFIDGKLYIKSRDGSLIGGSREYIDEFYRNEVHKTNSDLLYKYGIYGFPDIENVNEIEGFECNIDELDLSGLPKTFKFANREIDNAFPQKSIVFSIENLENKIEQTVLEVYKEIQKLKSEDLVNENNRIR